MKKKLKLLVVCGFAFALLGCANTLKSIQTWSDEGVLKRGLDKQYSVEEVRRAFTGIFNQGEFELLGKEDVRDNIIIYKHRHKFKSGESKSWFWFGKDVIHYSARVLYYKVVDGVNKDWAYYFDQDIELEICRSFGFKGFKGFKSCTTVVQSNNTVESYDMLVKTSSGSTIASWREN